jgi:hypothetical protein
MRHMGSRTFAALALVMASAACSSAPADDIAPTSAEQQADDTPPTADAGALFCEEQGRFAVQGGVVLDDGGAAPLQWQRDIPPASLTQPEAVAFCDSLVLDGAGWRLPTVSELSSLVLHPLGLGASTSPTCIPSIDQVAFPATPPDDFWTSTSDSALGDATYTDFRDGRSHAGDPTTPMSVRCVRAPQGSPSML